MKDLLERTAVSNDTVMEDKNKDIKAWGDFSVYTITKGIVV